ncbi:BlaI/MecI/CopY family transcriptional regulator [Streptomyces canus]|uniref:BlaI/MecI/CopY family transcriptional regulator n=1 Tax=Streptomyces canus TaxID=58343 RepID=UPI003807B500
MPGPSAGHRLVIRVREHRTGGARGGAARAAPVRLNSERPQPLAYNTVHTVTEILHRKGWLTRAKDGRAFRYEATRSREEYAASLIDQVWATGADRTATLVRLFDEMDADEVAELRAALAARADGGRA